MSKISVGDTVIISKSIKESDYRDLGWCEEMEYFGGRKATVSSIYDDAEYVGLDVGGVLYSILQKDLQPYYLKEGDGCRAPSAAQREYVLARARELGIKTSYSVGYRDDGVLMCLSALGGGISICFCHPQSPATEGGYNSLTFDDFIERMERSGDMSTVYIRVASGSEYAAVISSDRKILQVGCRVFDRQDVAAIASRTKQIKHQNEPILFDDINKMAHFPGGHMVPYDKIQLVAKQMDMLID